MTNELIPGMAHRIRETLKRRVHGNTEIIRRINELAVDQIYAQAPPEEVERVVRTFPKDTADMKQWLRYRDEAERSLGTKEMHEWIRNLQKEHDIAPKAKKAA